MFAYFPRSRRCGVGCRVTNIAQSPSQDFSRLDTLSLSQCSSNSVVLGRYQSDPRYIFRFDGLDGHISIKNADYKGRGMPEADKVGLETFGLGTSAKGHRVVVTFPRYLSSMSSRHQQHWDSYRARGEAKMEMNWSPSAMGRGDRGSVDLRCATNGNFPHQ
jgi:hypothetical protein